MGRPQPLAAANCRSAKFSNAPMSNPPSCGRATPRWSVDSEVPGSAELNAGLLGKIAMVGVLPGLFSCRGCN